MSVCQKFGQNFLKKKNREVTPLGENLFHEKQFTLTK